MLICGPFHSTSNPPVGMGYLRGFLRARGVACELHDLNIESRRWLAGAGVDRALIDELYSQSCRTHLAEAMAWSWLDPAGAEAIVERAHRHPSPELRAFWETERLDRLVADEALGAASRLLRGWLDARVRELSGRAAGWVGLSTTITNLASNLYLARAFKQRDPDLLVVMGGPEVTDRNADELVGSFPWVDVAVQAPAYVSLATLAADPGRALTGPLLPGTCRRSPSGAIESSSARAWIDLDTLPPADWSGVDLRRYVPGFLLVDTPEAMAAWYPTIPIHSSQGCSYNACGFCYNVALYPRFAVQSPAHVVADLRHQVATVGSRGFFFTDFEFNSQPDRVLDLCRRIRELPFELRFYAWLRLDKVDRGQLEAMYAAGARQIFIGVEAVDDDLLRLMRKGYTARFALDQLELLTRFASERPDFRFEFNLITNYPGETLASVRNTLVQLADRPHLFHRRVAAVVEFMLHEGTHAFRELRGSAIGCNEPLLPPGASVRSYRHVYAAPPDPTATERREIWSAVRAFAQTHA